MRRRFSWFLPWAYARGHQPEYTRTKPGSFRRNNSGRPRTDLDRRRDVMFDQKHPDHWRYLRIRYPEFPRPQRPGRLWRLRGA